MKKLKLSAKRKSIDLSKQKRDEHIVLIPFLND